MKVPRTLRGLPRPAALPRTAARPSGAAQQPQSGPIRAPAPARSSRPRPRTPAAGPRPLAAPAGTRHRRSAAARSRPPGRLPPAQPQPHPAAVQVADGLADGGAHGASVGRWRSCRWACRRWSRFAWLGGQLGAGAARPGAPPGRGLPTLRGHRLPPGSQAPAEGGGARHGRGRPGPVGPTAGQGAGTTTRSPALLVTSAGLAPGGRCRPHRTTPPGGGLVAASCRHLRVGRRKLCGRAVAATFGWGAGNSAAEPVGRYLRLVRRREKLQREAKRTDDVSSHRYPNTRRRDGSSCGTPRRASSTLRQRVLAGVQLGAFPDDAVLLAGPPGDDVRAASSSRRSSPMRRYRRGSLVHVPVVGGSADAGHATRWPRPPKRPGVLGRCQFGAHWSASRSARTWRWGRPSGRCRGPAPGRDTPAAAAWSAQAL